MPLSLSPIFSLTNGESVLLVENRPRAGGGANAPLCHQEGKRPAREHSGEGAMDEMSFTEQYFYETCIAGLLAAILIMWLTS